MRKTVLVLLASAAILGGALGGALASGGGASAVTLTCVLGDFSVEVDGEKVVNPGNLDIGLEKFNANNAAGDSCTLS